MVRPGLALHGNDWSVLDGRWPADPPTVSVIVAHFEQPDELRRTLLALRRQDHPASLLEVIVVDDGSAQPPRVPEGVRLVAQEDRGFRLAAARNAGAAVATGQVLCFLDADTAPEPSYVRELTRLPALAPDVVTVGRRRHAELSALDDDARVEVLAPRVELPSPTWLDGAYRRSRDLLDSDDRSYRFVIGAVIACDRRLFEETGGFDESFTEYGGEDWEWAYRAWLRGAAFAHVPRAVAWHDGPEQAARGDREASGKNREALRLARLVPLPGSGPRGLRGEFADIEIALPDDADPADPAWFATLDAAAAALPLAAVPGDGRLRDRVRLRVDLLRPARIEPRALAAMVESVSAEGLGQLEAQDPGTGDPLVVVRATRSDTRSARWQRTDLLPRRALPVAGITPMSDVDVEAWLGGWDRG